MSNTIIGIIVALVVVGGGAYFFLGGTGEEMNDPSTSSGQGEEVMEENNEEVSDESENFTGNLASLFGLGRNVMCSFAQNDEFAEGSGTVYVAGDRVRADYQMMIKEGGGQMNGSSIVKDDTVYAWGSTPFGDFATKHSQLDDADTGNGDSQGFDLNEELDYECKRWNVDNSKFDLPSGVNFDDINANMQQMMGNIDMVEGLECSACDQIPDENAAAQCRAMLGC